MVWRDKPVEVKALRSLVAQFYGHDEKGKNLLLEELNDFGYNTRQDLLNFPPLTEEKTYTKNDKNVSIFAFFPSLQSLARRRKFEAIQRHVLCTLDSKQGSQDLLAEYLNDAKIVETMDESKLSDLLHALMLKGEDLGSLGLTREQYTEEINALKRMLFLKHKQDPSFRTWVLRQLRNGGTAVVHGLTAPVLATPATATAATKIVVTKTMNIFRNIGFCGVVSVSACLIETAFAVGAYYNGRRTAANFKHLSLRVKRAAVGNAASCVGFIAGAKVGAIAGGPLGPAGAVALGCLGGLIGAIYFDYKARSKCVVRGKKFYDFDAEEEIILTEIEKEELVCTALKDLDMPSDDVNQVTWVQIKKKFCAKALVDHPDKGGNEAAWTKIYLAYTLLKEHFKNSWTCPERKCATKHNFGDRCKKCRKKKPTDPPNEVEKHQDYIFRESEQKDGSFLLLPPTVSAPLREDLQLSSQLDQWVGLTSLKKSLKELLLHAKHQRARGADPNSPQHLVFRGNPGTGKTEVARWLQKTLFRMGLLAKDVFVEAQRGDLVGEYIGHTANKTRKQIDAAKGGLLFIDEAYRLSNISLNDFGKEAIEELMKDMLSGDPLIVFAGYPAEMKHFEEANAGLARRIYRRFDFVDYSAADLTEIFIKKVHTNNPKYKLTNEPMTRTLVEQAFQAFPTKVKAKENGSLASKLLRELNSAWELSVGDPDLVADHELETPTVDPELVRQALTRLREILAIPESKANSISCDCEEGQAVVSCVECDRLLCQQCDTQWHKGKRRKHQRSSLQ
jgi:hypothetical protein